MQRDVVGEQEAEVRVVKVRKLSVTLSVSSPRARRSLCSAP